MMKKIIMKSLLVVTMLVFTINLAIAAEPEVIMDKPYIFQSNKRYIMNITGTTGKDEKASNEIKTVDTYKSAFDEDNVTLEQLRLILLLMCIPVSWQAIPMNIQLQ